MVEPIQAFKSLVRAAFQIIAYNLSFRTVHKTMHLLECALIFVKKQSFLMNNIFKVLTLVYTVALIVCFAVSRFASRQDEDRFFLDRTFTSYDTIFKVLIFHLR